MLTRDDLVTLLRDLVHKDGSELHLKPPGPPLVRVAAGLIPTNAAPTTTSTTQELAGLLLAAGSLDGVALASVQHREFGFGVSGIGRFHATLYRQRGSLAIRIARIPFGAPSLDELGLTDAIDEMFAGPGLNLICGRERGAGLGAIVARYNRTRSGLLVDVADPIAYLHTDDRALIAQRGVHTDVASLAEGIRQAHRQRVEVVVVSDLPDCDTAEAALRAAEDGIAVVAAVGAPDANHAASWLLRLYRSERDLDAKARLKRVLRGIASVDGEGQARYIARRSGLKAAS
jgi:twitching motility protein PilT